MNSVQLRRGKFDTPLVTLLTAYVLQKNVDVPQPRRRELGHLQTSSLLTFKTGDGFEAESPLNSPTLYHNLPIWRVHLHV